MVESSPARVRIAPSPTGDPHVGTAYVALFNWAFARRTKGQFILRIEDTDRQRSTKESEEAILRALGWLGLDWDEGPDVGGPYGPYRQSERAEIYREHAQILIDKGAAYRCFCTPERLAALREEQKAAKKPMGYDGLCRGLKPEESEARAKAGEPYVVRLKVDKSGQTTVHDLLRDPVTFRNQEIDDQVLLKSDGFPTYHLANVVDDYLMKVTHVMRAEEWLVSTPKHVMLYEAFGWPLPKFIHLSLLRNADKSKISKRKNPVSLDYYREHGYLPQAMINFLALMGWSTEEDNECIPVEKFIEQFDPEDVSLGGPVFDLTKLDWLNGVYIRQYSPEELVDKLMEGPLKGRDLDRDFMIKIAPLVSERLKTLNDFDSVASFFFAEEIKLEEGAFKKVKRLDPDALAKVLESSAALMESQSTFQAEAMDTAFREMAKELGVKPGDVFLSLRIAVTGTTASPPLLESMELLGRDLSVARARSAAAWVRA